MPARPFDTVIDFLERNRSVLPNVIVQKAVFHGVVASEFVNGWRQHGNQIRITAIMRGHDSAPTGGPQRQAAKRIKDERMDYLERRTQRSEEVIREQLRGGVANQKGALYRIAVMQLFGPMLA